MPSIDGDTLTLITQRVSDLYGVSAALIASRDRSPDTIECRTVIYVCLRDRGYRISEIGRAFGRDHSTVLHALNSVKRRPQLGRLAFLVSAGVLPAAPPRSLAAAAGPAGAIVHDYLRAITGQAPIRPTHCRAVAAIAGSRALQAAVRGQLEAWGHGGQWWRVELHARQLGYVWERGAPARAAAAG